MLRATLSLQVSGLLPHLLLPQRPVHSPALRQWSHVARRGPGGAGKCSGKTGWGGLTPLLPRAPRTGLTRRAERPLWLCRTVHASPVRRPVSRAPLPGFAAFWEELVTEGTTSRQTQGSRWGAPVCGRGSASGPGPVSVSSSEEAYSEAATRHSPHGLLPSRALSWRSVSPETLPRLPR